jgi:hypothetical protein
MNAPTKKSRTNAGSDVERLLGDVSAVFTDSRLRLLRFRRVRRFMIYVDTRTKRKR